MAGTATISLFHPLPYPYTEVSKALPSYVSPEHIIRIDDYLRSALPKGIANFTRLTLEDGLENGTILGYITTMESTVKPGLGYFEEVIIPDPYKGELLSERPLCWTLSMDDAINRTRYWVPAITTSEGVQAARLRDILRALLFYREDSLLVQITKKAGQTIIPRETWGAWICP